MITDPSACLATFPVSTVRSRSPSLIDSFKYFFTAILTCLLQTTAALHKNRRDHARVSYAARSAYWLNQSIGPSVAWGTKDRVPWAKNVQNCCKSAKGATSFYNVKS